MSDDAGTTESRVFVDATLETFGFLIDLGFRATRRDPRFVRFESDAVFVNVYHGRSSYQLGVELGRLNRGELFSLYEVLSAFAPADVDLSRLQAVDADVLKRCLGTIAATVERRCGGLLVGDPDAFAALLATSSRLRESATLSAQFGAILDRADQAWIDGDRSRAADLYESASPALDETRRRRLAYVRDKQSAG
jgi:hypothetical protein